ncbi:putative signaling protein [Methylobacterium crusticola]|uniref:Signaling protein n=1 Tax=Methylobacterium crusticola TaxID=1697972 RepID=A0ABQ4R886_9HYPH|nr:EAL domain-containing protein [Methylobacterium crusticola]GJD52986.1 putative signaling protein [Methylobacterium crusticola]
MMTFVGCLVDTHDVRLAALAIVICALAAFTATGLLCHARRSAPRLRVAWLLVAALAGGSGIWATHFIAMLAFSPGLPSGYDVSLTAFSLLLAVVLVGGGFAVAAASEEAWAGWLGGAVVGGGIAAMHYTGMAAYQVAGRFAWDPVPAAASVVVGLLLASLAMLGTRRRTNAAGRTCGALLLLLAICGHHFTAMGAVTITPDPAVAVAETAVPTRWLAGAVALASFAILLLAGAALALDVRERRHAAVERERLRSLANAAVEGLVVCAGDLVVSANDSFAALVGLAAGQIAGSPLSAYLPGAAVQLALATRLEHPVEAHLLLPDGTALPVELIVRPVAYASQPHYAVAVRDLRARRLAEGRIHFLAHHDPLTGLANRASFNERLDQAMRVAEAAGGKLAVLCLDLDRFKDVNDLHGHAAGDAVLESLGRTVAGLLDGTQMMARLGGDEFAVLTPCAHAEAAGRLARQIIGQLASPPDPSTPQVTTSVGIAVYPDDARERTALLTCADAALHRAKSEGRGTCRFFDPAIGAEIRERRQLEHDLRHAVARAELELVYQPQARVETGAVIGFEALLRWRHPERGTVSPAVFIPIAEESGAILAIGEWALREACREAATWTGSASVAVNVSAVQIHGPHFARLVHEVLFQSGLEPRRLEIEVTETALIRDPARALHTLRSIKALGVTVAMDDFGTGYSSLSNLRTFPFDKIKIDGSFVRSVHSNAQAAAIVRSVLGLGRGLGLPVVAEGVETAEELRFLAQECCDAAQGYLIGRPAPIGQFAQHTHGGGRVPPTPAEAA